MVTLTLYKNLDEDQPITFKARMMGKVTLKLSEWMDKNNGTFDPRQGTYPMGCDGLTVFLEDWPGDIVLCYMEIYKEWEITFDQDPANPEGYTNYADARERFVQLADDWGEWEEA